MSDALRITLRSLRWRTLGPHRSPSTTPILLAMLRNSSPVRSDPHGIRGSRADMLLVDVLRMLRGALTPRA
jgi:hypothetical protein